MVERDAARGPELNRLHSVKRVIAVLEALAERPYGLTPKELSQELGLHLSTSYRLLNTLQETGYVTRVPGNGLFKLGARVAYLHRGYLTALPLPAAARPFLRALQQVTGETVMLSHLEGYDVVFTEVVEGSRPGAIPPGYAGMAMPAHFPAAGRVLLAALPAEALEAYVAHQMAHPAPLFPLASPGALRADLEHIRLAGCAIDRGSGHRDVWCVAAPVAGPASAAAAAIAVIAHSARVAREEPALIAAIRSTAQAIEAVQSPLPYPEETHADDDVPSGAAGRAEIEAIAAAISRAMSRAVSPA